MRIPLSLLTLLISTPVWALQPGDRVPDMALPSTSGEEVRLTDFAGTWVVLYFYPRAFTPGCTDQACSLRDEYGELQERGAIVLGVSLDSPERILSFKQEHHLPFELLSDGDKNLSRAFDSLMVGGLMAARKTFIINPDGVVAHRFDRPKTAGHADEVIAHLVELQAE